jgi:V/A-type H+-transporting ATPase subunit K
MIDALAPLIDVVLATTNATAPNGSAAAAAAEPLIPAKAAAALAVGLAAFGSGYAERGIGSAAVGATAENPDMFGRGLILTVIPETLVILALVTIFVV